MWFDDGMKLGQHCHARLEKLEGNKKCRCYMWLLHATRTPRLLFGHENYSFILSKGNQKSMWCCLAPEQSFKKRDIFKWCSIIAGPRWTPTGTPHSVKLCIVSVGLFLLVWGEKKISFPVDPTPFPVGSTIHQHAVSTTPVQNYWKKRKSHCSGNIRSNTDHTGFFFKWGKTTIIRILISRFSPEGHFCWIQKTQKFPKQLWT